MRPKAGLTPKTATGAGEKHPTQGQIEGGKPKIRTLSVRNTPAGLLFRPSLDYQLNPFRVPKRGASKNLDLGHSCGDDHTSHSLWANSFQLADDRVALQVYRRWVLAQIIHQYRELHQCAATDLLN